MSINKEKALAKINKDFESYSNQILRQLRLLENIINTDFINSDSQLIPEDIYEEIKKREKEIDKFEVKISEDVLSIIVLFNPVASELRQLMAYYRLSSIMERIADMIFNIARYIKKIKSPELYKKFSGTISDMLVISINMVEKSLLAFNTSDIEYAIWTIKNDDIVDDLNRSFVKKLIKSEFPEMKSKAELSTFISLRSIVSNIERIADNATNIAEAAIFAIEGRDVRHKKINKIERR